MMYVITLQLFHDTEVLSRAKKLRVILISWR